MNTPTLPSPRPCFGLGPEYNGFLYALLAEGKNGMPLSVLSALAQLELDPWDTAGQLTVLPRDTSVPLLASMLERLPACPSDRSACERIAVRLVELLPSHQQEPQTSWLEVEVISGEPRVPVSLRARIQLVVAFVLLFLVAQSMLSGFTAHGTGAPHPRDDVARAHTSEPTPPGR